MTYQSLSLLLVATTMSILISSLSDSIRIESNGIDNPEQDPERRMIGKK